MEYGLAGQKTVMGVVENRRSESKRNKAETYLRYWARVDGSERRAPPKQQRAR